MGTQDRGESRRLRSFLQRWKLTKGDLGRALLALLGATIGLLISSVLLPDFNIGGVWNSFITALNVFVLGVILRPLMVRLSIYLGWIGAGLVGFFGQAVIIFVAVWEPTSGARNTLVGALLASWIVAAVSTLLVYFATAGTDDAVTASLLRRARRRPQVVADPEIPGILFVQADGLPYPVLRWAVQTGTLPTLSRWVRSGSYHLNEWRPKLPATTPASQMGILHGTIDGIPAFRWVDRAAGKIYVANRPADAALIEARHSNGRGLLADDGVSVSNLFTGDAPTAYATMSAVDRTTETRETRLALNQYLASPTGLARSIPKILTEIVRERFQSMRAIRRDVQPRVHRGWNFSVERAALAGVLRDLNTALVADAMLKGRRSIYVDYVDYDAVAHHVGMVRPEALDALAGIDAILGRLERVAEVAPRKYHIVVVSDHGQSQGQVFADRYGEDLAGLVSRLAGIEVEGSEETNHEALGSLNSVLASSADDSSVIGRAMDKTSTRIAKESFGDGAEQGAAELRAQPGALTKADRLASEGTTAERPFIVFGSGNLGLVYVAGEDHRLTREELDARYPALLEGVAGHPGVGFVVVDTTEHGPVAFGARGEHRVRDGVVIGEDPLEPFGSHAASFVLRAASMPETPDLLVNSLVDELGEVAAFEGLVGCHGGLGGWQDRAVLLWPDALPPPPPGMVVGADALHEVLVGWLEHLGHRTSLTTPAG